MSEVKFLVLGPVGACLDGTPVGLTGSTALTTLAGLLVSANEGVTRETLIHWAWPRRTPLAGAAPRTRARFSYHARSHRPV